MADTDTTVTLKDPHNVPVTFVNEVSGIGFLNGVINLTFATALFTPVGREVETDLIVSSRIRMDLYAAQNLHALLGQLIAEHTKGPAQPKSSEAQN